VGLHGGIASYTDKEKNAVGLKVSFGALADGAIYPRTSLST